MALPRRKPRTVGSVGGVINAQRGRVGPRLPGGQGLVPASPMAQPPASPPGQPQAPSTQFTPDAEYLAAAAQRQFARQQALQQITTDTANDKTDTQEAIRRLLQAAPDQRQGIKVGANKQGLFYSGQLGKRLGDLEADLTQRQGDINLDFQRREQARAAARAAIEQGKPLEEAAALAEAASRQIARDVEAANANALASSPPLAPAKGATNWATQKKNGKYKWPDGKGYVHSRPYRGR